MRKVDWPFRVVMVCAVVIVGSMAGELQRFRTVTNTEELDHRLALIETASVPETVCIDDSLNIKTVPTIGEAPNNTVVFHWPRRNLLVRTNETWYVMTKQSYTWKPGRCQ